MKRKKLCRESDDADGPPETKEKFDKGTVLHCVTTHNTNIYIVLLGMKLLTYFI